MGRPPENALFDRGYQRWVSGNLDADGLRTGAWRHHREDGSLYSEMPWEAGLPVGVARHFHPDETLAAETLWNGQYIERATYLRGSDSDLDFFAGVDASIVRMEARAGTPFTWGARRYFVEAGAEVNADGTPLLPRPDAVPNNAELVLMGSSTHAPPHWVSGDVEQGSAQPIGLRTWHATSGDLLRHTAYDERGRRRWSRLAIAADPVPDKLASFFSRSRSFPSEELRSHFDLELHGALRKTLRQHSTAHVASYASALRCLDRQDGRTRWVHRPRWDLIVNLFEDWRQRGEPIEGDGVELLRLSVEAMLELRQRASIERWWPELEPHDASLASRVEALANRAPDWRDQAAEAGAVNPEIVLQAGDCALVVDAFERAFVLESEKLTPAPITVDRHGPTLSRHMLPFGRSDARSLHFGAEGWWLLQRYGPHLYLSTSRFDDRSFAHVTDLDLFFRCPGASWTRRLETLIEQARPLDAELVVDGTVDGEVLLREYTSSVERVNGPRRRFLGGAGTRFVAGHGADPDDGRFPTRDRHDGSAQLTSVEVDSAGDRLDREEAVLFQQGHVLRRILLASEL